MPYVKYHCQTNRGCYEEVMSSAANRRSQSWTVTSRHNRWPAVFSCTRALPIINSDFTSPQVACCLFLYQGTAKRLQSFLASQLATWLGFVYRVVSLYRTISARYRTIFRKILGFPNIGWRKKTRYDIVRYSLCRMMFDKNTIFDK